jgi:quercetin dioxygenase-like cupin family protein
MTHWRWIGERLALVIVVATGTALGATFLGGTGAAQGQPAAAQALTPAEQEERLARVGRSVPVESNINTALRRFEPGNRTYWHSHEGGFILFVQEGRARVQTRGGRMRELGPGEVDYAPPGVEHWHGAAPNEPLLQLGVVPFGGGITFLEPVSAAQYDGTARD